MSDRGSLRALPIACSASVRAIRLARFRVVEGLTAASCACKIAGDWAGEIESVLGLSASRQPMSLQYFAAKEGFETDPQGSREARLRISSAADHRKVPSDAVGWARRHSFHSGRRPHDVSGIPENRLKEPASKGSLVFRSCSPSKRRRGEICRLWNECANVNFDLTCDAQTRPW